MKKSTSDRRLAFIMTVLLGAVVTVFAVNPAIAALVSQLLVTVPFVVAVGILLYSVIRELTVTGAINWKSKDFGFDVPYFEKEVEDVGKDAGTPAGGEQ